MKKSANTSKCNSIHSLSVDSKVEVQQAAIITFDLSGSDPANEQ
jgi:hypothetical protein